MTLVPSSLSSLISSPFPSSFHLSLFLLPPSLRALFGHWENNPNVIYFIGSGSGGAEEMVLEMENSQVMYALGTCMCVEEWMCVIWSMKEREREWLQYYVILAPTLMCRGLDTLLSLWSRLNGALFVVLSEMLIYQSPLNPVYTDG